MNVVTISVLPSVHPSSPFSSLYPSLILILLLLFFLFFFLFSFSSSFSFPSSRPPFLHIIIINSSSPLPPPPLSLLYHHHILSFLFPLLLLSLPSSPLSLIFWLLGNTLQCSLLTLALSSGIMPGREQGTTWFASDRIQQATCKSSALSVILLLWSWSLTFSLDINTLLSFSRPFYLEQ